MYVPQRRSGYVMTGVMQLLRGDPCFLLGENVEYMRFWTMCYLLPLEIQIFVRGGPGLTPLRLVIGSCLMGTAIVIIITYDCPLFELLNLT